MLLVSIKQSAKVCTMYQTEQMEVN